MEDKEKSKKEISSVVRRLRFMRVKDEEFYRQQLKNERQKLQKSLEWCAPGWEDAEEMYIEQLKLRRLEEHVADGLQNESKLKPSVLRVQGRRSFGNYNPAVEGFMSLVEKRVNKMKGNTREFEFAFSFQKNAARSKKVKQIKK